MTMTVRPEESRRLLASPLGTIPALMRPYQIKPFSGDQTQITDVAYNKPTDPIPSHIR